MAANQDQVVGAGDSAAFDEGLEVGAGPSSIMSLLDIGGFDVLHYRGENTPTVVIVVVVFLYL